jgi:integrase/recombinase XerD
MMPGILSSFARFASAQGETHVVAQTAMTWAGLARSESQRATRLKAVIRFARFSRAADARHELPPQGVFRPQRHRPVPYLFRPEEIQALMAHAAQLGPAGSLRPQMYSTLIGLLAATGLRISEALGLCFRNITPDGLVMRETKFRKSRLEVVEHTGKGFQVVPHRWVVERAFAWLLNYRRHRCDYEVLSATSEAMVQISMIHLLLKRLA